MENQEIGQDKEDITFFNAFVKIAFYAIVMLLIVLLVIFGMDAANKYFDAFDISDTAKQFTNAISCLVGFCAMYFSLEKPTAKIIETLEKREAMANRNQPKEA